MTPFPSALSKTKYIMNQKTFFKTRRDVLIGMLLVIVTLAVYGQVTNYGFINYDDPKYVYDNPYIQSGLNKESVFWSLTATYVSNWHPITWLSHMIDVEIYGINPGGHHLTNVIFHIVNSLLLCIILKKATGGLWQSGFVAALFALHPLHVESVAWISERKDVLSALFWMLTMWGYIAYVERPNIYRYILVVVFFILGLMAKPMLVTLPFVLLLLDYWPLKRLKIENCQLSRKGFRPLIFILRSSVFWEKIPLFLLVAASCIITFSVQKTGGAVGSLEILPLNTRIANALVSYISYVVKMVWPFNLSVFYPHPKLLPAWQVAGAGFLILTISLFVILNIRVRPYFFVGWLWYLVTLIPVIGLVQVGRQAMADRYTYIPLIGLFIVIAWEGSSSVLKWCSKKWSEENEQTSYGHLILSMAAISTLIVFSVVTWFQIQVWDNSIKLYEHALRVSGDSYVMHYNLGNTFFYQDKFDKAIDHYEQALSIDTQSSEANNNLGLALFRMNRIDEAVGRYLHALHLDPHFSEPHNNLGNVYASQGELNKAIHHYHEALRLDPKLSDAHNNLGLALIQKGFIDKAIARFQKTLEIEPHHAGAARNLNRALAIKVKIDKAVSNMYEAIEIHPDDPDLQSRLSMLYKRKKELDEAVTYYKSRLTTLPGYSEKTLNIDNYPKVSIANREYENALSLLKRLDAH